MRESGKRVVVAPHDGVKGDVMAPAQNPVGNTHDRQSGVGQAYEHESDLSTQGRRRFG